MVDVDGIENCYITDIVISSNDPRYQIIVDSFFFFEFDENGTMFESEVFEVYPNNHLEKFYFGDYADIYSENIVFDSGSYPPVYYDDSGVNETFYFDAFDTAGNYYYFDDHLFGETVSQGIYDISWNPMHSEHYNAWYYDESTPSEELQDLFEAYNPHIEKFRYLYLSWADVDSWKEWHLIDTPNVNESTMEVTFECYDDVAEEYESVLYDQALDEFETRHISIENIYPYDTDTISETFDLSQDYTSAQYLGILSITGYYFDETEYEFNLGNCYIVSGEESIYIESETGVELSDFDQIVVLLSFESGNIKSDYSQFRMKDDAITNHPAAPAWTKNDSLYVDYEYADLDYFLLMEDYEVGSEDSLFELLEYTRNVNFVQIEQENFVFDIIYHSTDYENFSAQIDYKSVLEMVDFNEDGTHESVVEKHDVNGDGIYNVFKYGFIDSVGEILYRSIVLEADTSQEQVDKQAETKKTEWFDLEDLEYFGTKARRTLYTTSITNNEVTTYYCSVQEDVDLDGFMDKEASYEVIYNNIEVTTYAKEVTDTKLFDVVEPATEELRISTFVDSKMDQTMTFVDLVNGEEISTRLYEDAFPNELSDFNGIDNYLVSIVSSSTVSQTPDLSAVFSLSHSQDDVPAEFDRVTTIENGEVISDNILFRSQTVEIPGVYSVNGQGFESYTIDAIKAVPLEGTYWANDLKSSSFSNRDKDGYYLYFDSSEDGIYETVFVMDKYNNVVGIGFDYDQDSNFIPGRTIPVEKSIVWNKNYADMSDKHIHFNEIYKEVGKFNEPTFSDVLFDVSKMTFSDGGSELIRLAEGIATNQFEESVNLFEDVFQQVVAGLAGVAGAVLAAVISEGTLTQVGFMLGYLGVTLAFQSVKIAEQDNYIAHRTFSLVGSGGEKTLGEKFWFDDIFGNVMPITMFGSIGGVYAPVYGSTRDQDYSADIIIREFISSESKASSFTCSYTYPEVNYWLSTRNLAGYTNRHDKVVLNHLENTLTIGVLVHDFGPPEWNHALSSKYYIENQVKAKTEDNNDLYLNTVIPTIDYDYENNRYSPRFGFVDSQTSFPVPEFYTEYPVFVEEGSSIVNDYVSIYKSVPLPYDESLPSEITIQIFPGDIGLKSDIVYVESHAKLFYDMSGDGDFARIQRSELVIGPEDFEFEKDTGIITIKESSELYDVLEGYFLFISCTEGEEVESEPSDYYVTLVLEAKVEKYRSVADLRDLTEEQVNKIATAQAVEAAILEYNYQFNLATQTQMGYHEIIYTATVTAISTIIIMAATYGAGSLLNSLGITTSTVPGKVLVEGGAKTVSPGVERMLLHILERADSITLSSIAVSVLSEMGQEILLDPWIESTVSGLVRRAGGNAYMQMILSSLAESGRESFSGAFTGLASIGQQQHSVRSTLDSKFFSRGLQPTVQQVIEMFNQFKAEAKMQQQLRREQLGVLGKASKALSFVSKAIGFATAMFLGPVAALTYTTVGTYCLTEEISLKGVFKKIFNPVIIAISNSKVADYVRNNKMKVLSLVGMGVLGATMMGLQVLLPALSGLGTFGSLGLGFGGLTIGMVDIKQRKSTKNDIQKSIVEYTGPIVFKNRVKDLRIPDLEDRSIRDVTETVEFIDNTWADGRAPKGAVFGIIYLWINKENGKIYWGRTEQRLFHYRNKVPISDRFYDYYKDAKNYYKKDGSLYHHMHEAIGKQTNEQDAIRALFEQFELKVFEIVYSSGNFDSDCDRIEAIEEWWITKTDSRNKAIGYNIRGGSIGTHTGHSKIDIDMGLLKRLIQSGYSQKQVANYFGVERKTIFNRLKEGWPDTGGNWYLAVRKFVKPLLERYIKSGMEQEEIRRQFSSPYSSDGYMSRSQLYSIFEDCFEGDHFDALQDTYLNSIIDTLLDQGYRTPAEIASKLKNIDTGGVWKFLVMRKVAYAISLIEDFISKGFITTKTLANELNLPQHVIEKFLLKKMRGIRIEKLELYDRPRAWRHILESETPKDLLSILGYTQSTLSSYRQSGKIESMVEKILGVSYNIAKIRAATGYIGES